MDAAFNVSNDGLIQWSIRITLNFEDLLLSISYGFEIISITKIPDAFIVLLGKMLSLRSKKFQKTVTISFLWRRATACCNLGECFADRVSNTFETGKVFSGKRSANFALTS